MVEHAKEVAEGRRFEFGKNWQQFLTTLNDDRIAEAEKSLCQMLGVTSLMGKRFLDIGSGSGLFSLAARRLGAQVVSFDYDPQSVACTNELKQRYFHNDEQWQVDQGSALDQNYLRSLGEFDIVYSWGVLHHTGDMWQALENAISLLSANSRLFISIYNDQGLRSRLWWQVKKTYNQAPQLLRYPIIWVVFIQMWAPIFLRDLLLHRNPLWSWRNYYQSRGMSVWWDVIDWVGGYPFEVARPEKIFDFCRERGLVLLRLKTSRAEITCNEYVFIKPVS
ncbi:MAG: SAM-dependent methyltransferase [Chloroflexota bacterium]|nr:class I SAM-dependent methyltransferase [Chloroflexota bacterium]NOG64560.1 class I SAM-dependent methyltransferase [Chloroflexota bacterium]GIK63441.1 MAG: SAM-dependent methyltransferase [Chloroflexota bacterium]